MAPLPLVTHPLACPRCATTHVYRARGEDPTRLSCRTCGHAFDHPDPVLARELDAGVESITVRDPDVVAACHALTEDRPS